MKAIKILLMVLFLTSCSSASVLRSDPELYGSTSNSNEQVPLIFNSLLNDIHFIDVISNQIYYLDLNQDNKKPINVGASYFIDGAPYNPSIIQKMKNYTELISPLEVFSINESMFFILERVDADGMQKYIFAESNLDGSNIKHHIDLDSYPVDFLVVDEKLLINIDQGEDNDYNLLQVYDAKLKKIADIQIPKNSSRLFYHNNKVFTEVENIANNEHGFTTLIYEINLEDGKVLEIMEGFSSISTMNENHYALTTFTDFAEDGFPIAFSSSIHSADSHEQIFELEDLLIHQIKDGYVIASPYEGNQIYYRYKLDGTYVDEIRPSEFIPLSYLKEFYSEDAIPNKVDGFETDFFTSPIRYGNDIIIARTFHKIDTDFVICNFKSKSCDLVSY